MTTYITKQMEESFGKSQYFEWAMEMLINKTGECQMKKMIDKYYKKLPLESVGEMPKYKPSKLWGDK